MSSTLEQGQQALARAMCRGGFPPKCQRMDSHQRRFSHVASVMQDRLLVATGSSRLQSCQHRRAALSILLSAEVALGGGGGFVWASSIGWRRGQCCGLRFEVL